MGISKELHDRICKKLVDEGRSIEAGFQSLRLTAIASDAPLVQLNEMHMAFFAGAQHLFATIMSILEPGAEPTEKDLERLSKIAEELSSFVEELKKVRPNEM